MFFLSVDVNEAPTDISLTQSQVRENEIALVGTVEVTDEDLNQRHNCTIVDTNTPFFIDNTGNKPTLRTHSPLDFESSRVNYVNIKCEDIVVDKRQTRYSKEKQFKIDVIGMHRYFILDYFICLKLK